MSDSLGYVLIDRNTLKAAEASAEADRLSCVMRHAKVETAADRARRRASRVEARTRPAVLAFTRGGGK